MGDQVDDLKALAKRHIGTMGPACMTCAFARRFGSCGYYNGEQRIARLDTKRCGLEGKWWEPRQPRLGLIPWLRRLLWGDP